MVFNESEPEVVDSNGQKFLVGWDDYGWFTIMMVNIYPHTAAIDSDDRGTVEHEGETYVWETVGEAPAYSFPKEEAAEVADLLSEGL